MNTIAPSTCRFEQVHENIEANDVPRFITESLERIKAEATISGHTLDWRTLELRYTGNSTGYRIQVLGTK